MDTYQTWVRLFELQRYYSWIVDRFHLSTEAYRLKTLGKEYDFGWLEDRFKNLGFQLVLCTRAPHSFKSAREERLRILGKPSQYDDLKPFIMEQETMRETVKASKLPSLVVDITDNNIAKATEHIADWMEETGGLWMN